MARAWRPKEEVCRATKKPLTPCEPRLFAASCCLLPAVDGGAEGDRTLDLRIANAALSQLSYRPTSTAPFRSLPSTLRVTPGRNGRAVYQPLRPIRQALVVVTAAPHRRALPYRSFPVRNAAGRSFRAQWPRLMRAPKYSTRARIARLAAAAPKVGRKGSRRWQMSEGSRPFRAIRRPIFRDA